MNQSKVGIKKSTRRLQVKAVSSQEGTEVASGRHKRRAKLTADLSHSLLGPPPHCACRARSNISEFFLRFSSSQPYRRVSFECTPIGERPCYDDGTGQTSWVYFQVPPWQASRVCHAMDASVRTCSCRCCGCYTNSL